MGSFGKNIKEKALHQRAEPFFDAPCMNSYSEFYHFKYSKGYSNEF